MKDTNLNMDSYCISLTIHSGLQGLCIVSLRVFSSLCFWYGDIDTMSFDPNHHFGQVGYFSV